MDWRICQNGLAQSPKWTSVYDTLYMCIYSCGLGAFAARDPLLGAGAPGAHAAKAPSPLEYIHTCIMHALVHFGECANPFWRMRQSILSNAPIYLCEYIVLCNIFTSISFYYYVIIISLFYLFAFLYVVGHTA